MSLALVTALILETIAAAPDACERTWAAAEKPTRAESEACVHHVLELAYGAGFSADALELDPPRGTAEALRLQSADLLHMAKHVRALCDDGCTDVAKTPERARAAEWLEAEAAARFALTDPWMMASIEPLLADVLAGRVLPQKTIVPIVLGESWSPLTLWKLRNAVFARHGKTFESADLTRFFYGPDAPKAAGLPLAPPKDAWSDAKLVAADKENVARLRTAEKNLSAAKKR